MSDEVRRLRCGPETGRMLLRTRRQGVAARAGHDLTIEVTRWWAQVDVPGDDRAAAHLSAEIDLDSLEVREGTGGAKPLTEKDRRDIESTARRLLGGGAAGFASTAVLPGAEGGGVIEGVLTLRGIGRPLRLEVSRTGEDRYRATTSVIQSEHGIRPYSAFLGALKLRDEVEVEVEVDLRRAGTEQPPQPPPPAG